MKVLIVGAGGHGIVILDILNNMIKNGKNIEVFGFLDDDPSLIGSKVSGLTVLGNIEHIQSIPHDSVTIAVGNNKIRQTIAQQLVKQGEHFLNVIHPTAVIADSVQLGSGCMICANAVINPDAILGNHVIVNTASTLDHHNQVKDFVHIAPGVHTGGEVEIEEGAFIGIGSQILPSIKIGAWSMVGAGSTVINNVEYNQTVYGTPATNPEK